MSRNPGTLGPAFGVMRTTKHSAGAPSWQTHAGPAPYQHAAAALGELDIRRAHVGPNTQGTRLQRMDAVHAFMKAYRGPRTKGALRRALSVFVPSVEELIAYAAAQVAAGDIHHAADRYDPLAARRSIRADVRFWAGLTKFREVD